MKSDDLLFICNGQFFCFSSTFFCLIKYLLILQPTSFTFKNRAICMGVSPISLFFPADHWIPILILILLILCLSPYNAILHINTIHSHFCYYCNLFHLFIYESLKYNGRRTSVEICHDAQEMLRVLCALPFPVCAGPVHPLMFAAFVQSYARLSDFIPYL